jgi:hypothetical protein
MTDDMREEKVAKLSPEMRERVAKKKRQLELVSNKLGKLF